MANPWPASLPQKPQKDGYSEILPDPTIIRSPMDTAVKVRRRSTAGIGKINCIFDMDDTQGDTLEVFWKTTLSHGTIKFSWDHPRTGVTYTDKWRFVSPPVYAPQGDGYKISCEFELLP